MVIYKLYEKQQYYDSLIMFRTRNAILVSFIPMPTAAVLSRILMNGIAVKRKVNRLRTEAPYIGRLLKQYQHCFYSVLCLSDISPEMIFKRHFLTLERCKCQDMQNGCILQTSRILGLKIFAYFNSHLGHSMVHGMSF